MILVDTSAWIEFDRATGSAVDRRLTELIAGDGPIAVTEPVVMEVLAGARSDAQEVDLRRLLLRFHLDRFDPAADFDGAVRIYRRCRGVGVTPRGIVDCLIASVAWRSGSTLLAHDADLDRIAAVVGIDLDVPEGVMRSRNDVGPAPLQLRHCSSGPALIGSEAAVALSQALGTVGATEVAR